MVGLKSFMKNTLQKIIANSLVWYIAGAVTIICIFWRPWEVPFDVLPLKPVQTIVQETEAKAQPAEQLVKRLEIENRLKGDSVAVFKSKWKDAVAENTRLRKMAAPASRMHIDFYEAHAERMQELSNGTAEDYITEIQTAAANSDTACAQTIGAMERQQLKTDSLYQSQRFISGIYKTGFEQMKEAASARDLQIKQLNKKLRWQKVQNVSFKVVAIAVAALVIKNQIK